MHVIERENAESNHDHNQPFLRGSASLQITPPNSPFLDNGSKYPLYPENTVGDVVSSPNFEFHDEKKTYQIEVSIESGFK